MKPYYQDNAVTIYHGDCREILPAIGTVGLICTDPPYGVGIAYNSYVDKAEATADLIIDFLRIAEPMAGIIALTAGNWQTELRLYQQRPPKWRMCWYKGSQSTASAIGFNDWEAVMIYGEKVHRNAHDYFFAQPELMGKFGHPCPKPIQFCVHLINRLARPGEIVCDPFAGSGTALRAAKDTGHKAIGIEIDERYCEISAKRMEQEVLALSDACPLGNAAPSDSGLLIPK